MSFIIYNGTKISAGKELDLREDKISDISELEGLEKLTDLKTLILLKNKIKEIKNLENLSELRLLEISNNELTEIKGLENLNNLKRLFLSNNQITEIKGLENLSNLVHLALHGNQISEIKGLENLINLKSIYLSGNQISEIKGLENLTNLKVLYLHENRISEIKGLDNLINLKRLYLGQNQIKEINGLENLPKLRLLGLVGNKIAELKEVAKISRKIMFGIEGNPVNFGELRRRPKELITLDCKLLDDVEFYKQMDTIKGIISLRNQDNRPIPLKKVQVRLIENWKEWVEIKEYSGGDYYEQPRSSVDYYNPEYRWVTDYSSSPPERVYIDISINPMYSHLSTRSYNIPSYNTSYSTSYRGSYGSAESGWYAKKKTHKKIVLYDKGDFIEPQTTQEIEFSVPMPNKIKDKSKHWGTKGHQAWMFGLFFFVNRRFIHSTKIPVEGTKGGDISMYSASRYTLFF